MTGDSWSAFQVLTNHRPDTGPASTHPPDNVILGVSVEVPTRRYRPEWHRYQPAATRFVSFEPLIEPIPEVGLTGIRAIIALAKAGKSESDVPINDSNIPEA